MGTLLLEAQWRNILPSPEATLTQYKTEPELMDELDMGMTNWDFTPENAALLLVYKEASSGLEIETVRVVLVLGVITTTKAPLWPAPFSISTFPEGVKQKHRVLFIYTAPQH